MRMAEILRKLADIVDKAESGEQSEKPNQAALTQVPSEIPGEAGPKSPDAQLDKMVPPLQQKLELLKKATGVSNEFDGNDSNSAVEVEVEVEPEQDELSRMKKMAGIHFGSEDNDVVG